jgi:tape measure domain-containing protein
MSDNSLGDMVVRYRADLTNLVQGSQRAQEEIRKTGTVASETGSKFAGGFSGAVEHARGSLLSLGIQLTTVAMGLKGLIEASIQTAEAMFAPSAAMEQASVTMNTLMGSTQAAQAELQQLWTFAANTPFEFSDVESAGAKLLAMGFAARDVIPDLTAVGDALSALGQATGADLQGVVEVLGQIKNTGHLMAQDMMQLTDRGIPAWRMLAEQMHLSVPALQAMVTKGLVPADLAITKLTKGMEQAFGGGMQKQSRTFTGLISTLHDNIEAAWRSMVGPAFQAAKKGLEDLGNLVASKSFQEFADVAGKVLAPAFQLIAQDIDQAAKGLQAWFDNKGNLGAFQGTMRGVADAVYDTWRAVKKVGDYIPSAVENFDRFNHMLDGTRRALDLNRGSIANVGDAIGWLVEGAFGALGALSAIVNFVESVFRKLAEGVNQFIAVADIFGAGIAPIDMSAFTGVSIGAFPENTRMSSGNFGGPGSSSFSGSGSSGTGGTGGTGGSSGSGSGGRKPPKKKPTAGSGDTGGVVAPPGSSSSSSGIGTGGTGGSGNNILIVVEIDGQVFASQVVKDIYDKVRLRLGPAGFAAIGNM